MAIRNSEPAVTPEVQYVSGNEKSTSGLGNELPKRTCSQRLFCVGFPIVFIAAITVGCMIYFGKPGNKVGTFFTPTSEPPGLNQTQQWETSGSGGLQLTILNAMEDKYTAAFDEYVERWDSGTPDALTLFSARVTPEVDCAPVTGQLKFCSGNYGNTDWRGISYNFVSNGFIRNSVSKVNNYHLDSENEFQRRYTVCHEMGHGFGLPHTDEKYWNLDRGDCLDYTIRPERNLSPGLYNYQLLAQLYGTVGNRLRRQLREQDTTRILNEVSGLEDLYSHAVMEGDGCADDFCVVHFSDDVRIEIHKHRVR